MKRILVPHEKKTQCHVSFFNALHFFPFSITVCDAQRKRECFSSCFHLKICLNQSWTECSVDDCVGAECKRRSRCLITFSFRFSMQKKHMHDRAVYIASELKVKKKSRKDGGEESGTHSSETAGCCCFFHPSLTSSCVRPISLAHASGAFVVPKLLTPTDRRLKVMRRNFKWKILKTSKLLKHGFVFHFISISLTTIFDYSVFFSRSFSLWTLEAELTLSFAHICRCEHCTGLLYRFKWMEPVVLPRCGCVTMCFVAYT